jgi:hypothetical protein
VKKKKDFRVEKEKDREEVEKETYREKGQRMGKTE